MTTTLTMSSIYAKISHLGLNQDYVRKNGLPSWWNDELNDQPLAVLEGAGYIANNLNLDLKSLLIAEEEIRFNSPPPTKFKQHNNQNKDHPYIAQALASRVAELIALGTEVDFTPLPVNVHQIRTEILTSHTTVNLISLLEYCWSQGIVIAHFHHFPDNTKKFAGLIQWQFSRPVIIISSKHKHSARLAFDLAHELGHLALGHLKEGILIDETIESDCYDDDECQADQFATQLLLGNCDNCLGNRKFKDARNFSDYVINNIIPQHPDIEPDAVILNYGWHNKKYFPLVSSALNKLQLDCHVNSWQIINEYLADRLDWDKFNDESYEYLEKVLGV